MSLRASSETAAYHSSPVAAAPTLAGEELPTMSGSPDGVGVTGLTNEDASMKLLCLEDVFLGGTEEERQEAQLALDKINVVRVQAQERRQEAHRRKSLTETLQKLQAEEDSVDKALSEVKQLRRINEEQRSKLLVEAEQLLSRKQKLIEKKAQVSQARARLIDEIGRKDCRVSSSRTEGVKAPSPPDSPADRSQAAHAGTATVPERTVTHEAGGFAPTNDQATPHTPLHEARRPQTASRVRPGTSSSTTRTLSGLWRRSSVTRRADSVGGDTSHDTTFRSSIASRRSSLGSVFGSFARRKELGPSTSIAKPNRDILCFYAQQGLDAKKKEEARQTQTEEDFEEIVHDTMAGAREENRTQGRMAMAYI